jgi:hypothetical protein
MSAGHRASTYALDDRTEIINEYDRYLAPRLSLREPRDPLDAKERMRRVKMFYFRPSKTSNRPWQVRESYLKDCYKERATHQRNSVSI